MARRWKDAHTVAGVPGPTTKAMFCNRLRFLWLVRHTHTHTHTHTFASMHECTHRGRPEPKRESNQGLVRGDGYSAVAAAPTKQASKQQPRKGGILRYTTTLQYVPGNHGGQNVGNSSWLKHKEGILHIHLFLLLLLLLWLQSSRLLLFLTLVLLVISIVHTSSSSSSSRSGGCRSIPMMRRQTNSTTTTTTTTSSMPLPRTIVTAAPTFSLIQKMGHGDCRSGTTRLVEAILLPPRPRGVVIMIIILITGQGKWHSS